MDIFHLEEVYLLIYLGILEKLFPHLKMNKHEHC